MVLGEGARLIRPVLQSALTRPISCQFCRLHVCTSNIGHSSGSLERIDRVRLASSDAGLVLLRFIFSAVLASFLLNEELGHLGRLGCALCLIGSLIIVLHAPEDKLVTTVDEILHYAIQPGTILTISLGPL